MLIEKVAWPHLPKGDMDDFFGWTLDMEIRIEMVPSMSVFGSPEWLDHFTPH